MNTRVKLSIVLIIISLAAVLNAAYLSNIPMKLQQPDSQVITLYASGDEYYNWLHDADGFTVKQDNDGWYKYIRFINDEPVFTSLIALRDNPVTIGLSANENVSSQRRTQIRAEKQRILRYNDNGRAPTSGTLNNIVIFIRFSDQTEFGETISNYNNMFNGTTGNNMQSYFLEASYGALSIPSTFYPTPSTMVVSWQDSNPRGYYSPYNATSNPIGYADDDQRVSREHTLLANAVVGVRSQIPTSLNLDADSDGNVDNVVFIIKGSSDGWAELLWPHRWSLYSQTVYINNKRVYDFNFQLSDFTNSSGNGVLSHEMFHSLGAPDLYHYSHDGISPVGPWDIMENNGNPPQHMGAYMKWKYGGWISNIPVINSPGTYTLNSLVSSTGNVFRINSAFSTSEYFLVEYRKKTGTFENSLPGSGLLVYRINTSAGNGNASGPPDEVYLYRPNGTLTVNGTVNSANYSLETGRTMINQYTNPSPFLQDGSNGGLYLFDIGSSAGTTISFSYSNSDPSISENEGFEDGILTPPWSFSGNSNWSADTSTFFSGMKSAKSGTISHNQNSTIQMTQNIEIPGQVSFFYKVSSEANYDYLKFYIDGVLQGQWSGQTDWAMAAYSVSPGSRTFKWEYMKDGSVNTGSDCAWIDHIAWPVPVFDPPQNLMGISENQQATLNWSVPATGSPSGYKVFRDTILLGTVSALSFTDTGLTNGQSYSYYVTAVYNSPSGESDPSNTIVITPGQSVNIGTGTTITATDAGCPINIWYKSLHGQAVYTATELNAAGVWGPVTITQIGFYISSQPALALPSFVLRMKHTSAANVSSWQSSDGMQTVYSNASYMPSTGGYDMLTLATPFVWNGTDNIVVDTAFGLVASYSTTGTVQYSSITNGYRFVRSDTENQSAIFAGGSTTNLRPNIRLSYFTTFTGPEISVSPESLAFGSVMVNTSSVQVFSIQNTGDQTLIGEITSPNGYSVTPTIRHSSQLQSQSVDVQSHAPLSKTDETYKILQNNLLRNTIPYTIGAGEAATFDVSFTPLTITEYAGSLIISHNASGPHESVLVSGQGAKPVLGLSSTSFSINLAPGQTNNQNLVVSNSGNLTLIYGLVISDSPSWLSLNEADSYNGSIATGASSHNIPIRYNASGLAPGTYRATIVCTSNDPTATSTIISVTLTVRIPIAITAPASGANWVGGSMRNIVFGYTGIGTSVGLYYSFDSGVTWISGGNLNVSYGTNTFSWIVPNNPTTACRIKLIDSIVPYAERISSTFNITSPSVALLTITAPDGGENWEINQRYNITWTHNILHPELMLYYSIDNGSNWTYLDSVPASDLSYSWLCPATPSEHCLVKLVVAQDYYTQAVSNSFHLIHPLPPVPPEHLILIQDDLTGAITLSWEASAGIITGYKVYLASNPDFSDEILLGIIPASQTNYTDPEAESRSRAFYRVRAVRE